MYSVMSIHMGTTMKWTHDDYKELVFPACQSVTMMIKE